MGYNPYVSLIAIVYSIWVWILRCESVVNAKHWHIKLDCPFSGVVLVCARILAYEATSMEVYYSIGMVLRVGKTHPLVM